MSYDTEDKNRRVFKRVNKKFMVTISKKDAPDFLFTITEINNISRGGLSFVSNDPFPREEELRLEVNAPLFPEVIVVKGVVLDSIAMPHAGHYHVRLKYNDVSEDVLDVLRQLEQYSEE